MVLLVTELDEYHDDREAETAEDARASNFEEVLDSREASETMSRTRQSRGKAPASSATNGERAGAGASREGGEISCQETLAALQQQQQQQQLWRNQWRTDPDVPKTLITPKAICAPYDGLSGCSPADGSPGLDSRPQPKLHSVGSKTSATSEPPQQQLAQQPWQCCHCGIKNTPQMREGPAGPRTLCNACGVRYRSGRLVPEYRPAGSPSFDRSRHSSYHKKIMERRRQTPSRKNGAQGENSTAKKS